MPHLHYAMIHNALILHSAQIAKAEHEPYSQLKNMYMLWEVEV